MHLLIISHDRIGSLMAGPGIRAWELARALANELQVTLIAPQPIDLDWPGLHLGSYVWGDPASLAIYTARAEVILANGYVLQAHPELATNEAALILDLYDPTLLENLELLRTAPAARRSAQTQQDVALLQRQLAAGDFFLCATERQRDLYLGALMAAGRISPERTDDDPLLRRLIEVLPFGLPSEPALRNGPGLRAAFPTFGPDDPIVLWSGGLWDWMDPLSLVQAMAQVATQLPTARLVFLAGRHPGVVAEPRAAEQARRLAAELGLLDRQIFFYTAWVPYTQRANFLLDATVVVSLHRQHLETAYAAVRSRFLDHLWAGLPAVVSAGDTAARLTEKHELGLVVAPQDPAAIAAALLELLNDPGQRAACAAQARALAPHFAWPTLVGPIRAWIAAPRPPRAVSRANHVMRTPPEAPAPLVDASRVERGALLHATRNAALKALEQGWQLERLPSVSPGRLGRLRSLLLDRLVWPLLYPLLARQQEQNAAVIRALYAQAEQLDYVGGISNQVLQGLIDTQRRLNQLSEEVEQLQTALDRLEQRTQQTEAQLAQLAAARQQIDERLDNLEQQALSTRHMLSQQIRDFAEQLAGLEAGEQQIRALLRGESAPPPTSVNKPEGKQP